MSPLVLSALFSQPSCTGLSRRVLYSIVAVESSSNPYAVHDDTDGRSYWPHDAQSGSNVIVRLTAARHSYSVGLMQIENSNWARYRVDGIHLLNPVVNVAIGCSIYRENLSALRGYNTGDPNPSAAGDRYAEAVLGGQRAAIADAIPTFAKPIVYRRRTPRRVVKPVSFGFSTPDAIVR